MIRSGLMVSAACIAVSIAAWSWLAQTLPHNVERVPIHWGISGAPDHFTTRNRAVMLFGLLPGLGLALAALFAVLPSLDPLRPNLAKGRRAFMAGWIGMEILLAVVAIGVAIMSVRSAGGDVGASLIFVRTIIAAVGLLFIFIGDALPKTRPNFFVGVRTPWTLTSDLSWEKTHRLAGRLFVLVGLWGVIAAFLLSGAPLAFAIGGPVIGVSLIAIVYSYFVWRDDPARRRPAAEAK